jgi:hypothetical protein
MATAAPAAPSTAAAPASIAPGPIYVDTQHEDLVHDAQMDYYGAKLATCSSGKFCLFLPYVVRTSVLTHSDTLSFFDQIAR